MGSSGAIEITPEKLRKIQLLQLMILKEIDVICRRNGIKYTLCGGSLLGAIRHNGFIPWDDDIDVSMLRDDYEKFLNICDKELDKEKFFLQTMETDPEYRLIYGRILLNGTKFVRNGQEHIKSRNGIFVDIFPRDGSSDNFFISKVQSVIALLMRKMLYSKVGAQRAKKWTSRFGFKILSKFDRKTAVKLLGFINKLNFGKDTERVVCWGLMGNNEKRKLEKGAKEYKKYKRNLKKLSKEEKIARKDREKGLKRQFFTDVEEHQFEDMTAMITSAYDIWLTYNYDDYMKLPPIEKQKMHQEVSSYSLGEYDDFQIG